MQLVGGLAFAFVCLGVGLLVSAIVYSIVDDLVFGVVDAVLEAVAFLMYLVGKGVQKLACAVKRRYFPTRRLA